MSELDLEVQTDDLEGAVSPQDDETPSDDPDAEPEPEDDPGDDPSATQPSEAQGETPEALEKLRKKLDTSAATWKRRVEELLGDSFQFLVPCELCGDDILGFHWPAQDMQPINDVQTALLEVLRQPLAPDYLQAQDHRKCTACDGYGTVLSGSRKAGKTTLDCSACKGFGYTPPPTGGRPTIVNTETGEITEEPEGYTAPPEDADVWGSPRILDDGQENPNYGKMPQYKDASLP